MHPTITGISSIATRHVLAELAAGYQAAAGQFVSIEAVGGVDAAKRVRTREVFDLVILAGNVIQRLEAEGHLVAGSVAPFVRSPMAMAVQTGAPQPDMSSEKSVKAALMDARSIGYSSGPSGDHLITVLRSWGLDPAVAPERFIQAKPGVAVASLIASGEAAIGVQQLSELLSQPGIDVLGILPPPVQSVTIFSIGIGAQSLHAEDAQTFINFLNASDADVIKRRYGMGPAQT